MVVGAAAASERQYVICLGRAMKDHPGQKSAPVVGYASATPVARRIPFLTALRILFAIGGLLAIGLGVITFAIGMASGDRFRAWWEGVLSFSIAAVCLSVAVFGKQPPQTNGR